MSGRLVSTVVEIATDKGRDEIEFTGPPGDLARICKGAIAAYEREHPDRVVSSATIGVDHGAPGRPYIMGHIWLAAENGWYHDQPATERLPEPLP